ncbi:25-hydroxycholesterol 7-alpha-hydroxylase [Colletotrichum tanaceti]|uniref:25-hydroxycholesterol 7-alpha-hydroxylase n=1 Tax=Colletotrichum tanaceti TaxID=1306861 RepID=A0A4U6XER9_9PEZI|nr:25-hydroxycholesterol 7-alpha-hydroxylase [Colletotrichum tanaceti]TKW53789.1 25-hydroxycholesterol 7-alpha-hydroxylase [Colletotrichum tanaceti]
MCLLYKFTEKCRHCHVQVAHYESRFGCEERVRTVADSTGDAVSWCPKGLREAEGEGVHPTLSFPALSEIIETILGNGALAAGSFLTFVVEDVQRSTSSYVAVAVVLALAMFIHRVSSPEMDRREPPPMKPTIPVVGHLVGMIRHQSGYFKTLENRNMAVATLPILNGKLYGIWEPAVIQSVYRNRLLSFEPFAVEFGQREIGFGNAMLKVIQETTLLPEFFDSIHQSMTAANLHRMNANALKYVSDALDGVCDGSETFEATNFFVWVRNLMTMATTEALYGPGNPLRKSANLMEDICVFDTDLPLLMLGVAPSITARKCYYARQRLQAALGEYYGNNGDYHEDAAQIVRSRAAVLRKHGISGKEVGMFEIALLHAATSNTIPTLFWFMAQVFSRPELVYELRKEVLPVAKRGSNDDVTINIGTINERCPLLVSCYREAIRLSNQGMGNRKVLEDTTVTDGKGQSYLLKKGCNVQVSAQVLHRLENAWGPDSASFKADRFVVKSGKEHAESEKMKRAAFIPFGGGRHLCPGRSFAFAENLGLMTSLLAGFEVSLLDQNMKETEEIPDAAGCSMTGAVVKPVDKGEGYGIRIRRRNGWESVKWRYIS